ncbi:MAG: hypothetical protein ACREF4_10695, partial [Gammaproteobacteria bacterium]
MALVWLRSLVRPGVAAAVVCLFTTTCILPSEPRLAAGVEISPNGGHNFRSLTETFQFTATARDRGGNALNRPVAWSSTRPTVVTIDAVTGVATAVDTGTGVAILASVDGVSSSVSVMVVQWPHHLGVVTQPSVTAAGGTIRPDSGVRIAVQDSLGKTVPSSSAGVTIAITSGTGAAGATLGGASPASAVDGVATFANLSIDKAGIGYTLTATSTGLTNATSGSFDIVGGAPTSLVITAAPTSWFAGETFTVTVVARDNLGNTASGFADTVTVALGINPTGDTLRGTAKVRAAGGTATFTDLRLRRAADYTLTATTPLAGVSPAQPVALEIKPGEPDALSFTRQPDTTRAGSPITPAVQVTLQDSLGNAITTFTGAMHMAIQNNPTGATLSGSVDEVAASGVATFPNLRIDRLGSGYTLLVSAPTAPVPSRTSDPFTITAGIATNLVFTEQPSSAQAGSPIRPGVGVKISVQDDQGNTDTTSTAPITLKITAGSGT